jgi:hypothetical protein
MEIIGAVAGYDVFVVGAAVENQMALARGFSGVGVVSHLVGVEGVRLVTNFDMSAQLVDRAVFFLGNRLDPHILLARDGGVGKKRLD